MYGMTDLLWQMPAHLSVLSFFIVFFFTICITLFLIHGCEWNYMSFEYIIIERFCNPSHKYALASLFTSINNNSKLLLKLEKKKKENK